MACMRIRQPGVNPKASPRLLTLPETRVDEIRAGPFKSAGLRQMLLKFLSGTQMNAVGYEIFTAVLAEQA